jgi:hypothetical protein
MQIGSSESPARKDEPYPSCVERLLWRRSSARIWKDETLSVDFFPFDDLPPLSSERTNERHLVEVAAHLHNPHRPAAFD